MFRNKDVKRKDDNTQINLVLLRTVKNNIELAILKGILDDKGIAYIIKDHGTGGHMRIISGDSAPFQTDILVDETTYDTAKDIIDRITFE